MVLVTPLWQPQAWLFPILLDLAVDYPLGLPKREDLLKDHLSRLDPLASPSANPLESVRGQLAAAGVSRQAADLLVAGWSQGTNSTYESAWRRWLCWCGAKQVDPISCGIQPFLDSIGSLFADGLQYRSINTIRSAVSITHEPIKGSPISQHPPVKQMLKGVYHARPPQPRYSGSWEVSKVVNYLANMGENGDLTLKSLSRKLAY